jgi:hypothetical protein
MAMAADVEAIASETDAEAARTNPARAGRLLRTRHAGYGAGSAAARYQRPGAPGVRQFVEGQWDWWLTCPMKLIFQIAAGILLAFFCMSVLSALVFFVGLRAWSQQVPVLNFPPLPSLQHQSMIQSVPVQPWPSLTARPVAVAPDLRCTNYVQGPDGQRHCYEKQSP